jgi:hypothetical protein
MTIVGSNARITIIAIRPAAGRGRTGGRRVAVTRIGETWVLPE